MAGSQFVVADLLEEKLKKGISKAAEHYEVTRLMSHLVLAQMRLMDQMKEKIWGNGVPGGLLQEVAFLNERMSNVQEELRGIDDKVDKLSVQTGRIDQFNIDQGVLRAPSVGDRIAPPTYESFPEYKLPVPAQPARDTFAQVLKWLSDKVLPGLVTVTILAVGQMILFLIAFQNGWIPVPAP